MSDGELVKSMWSFLIPMWTVNIANSVTLVFWPLVFKYLKFISKKYIYM